MNIIFLNPPNNVPVQRRFMCSYNAPNILLPPIELISLAGKLRYFENCKAYLIDAIAEKLDSISTIEKLASLKPDIIVTMPGFECFTEDMKVLEEIQQSLPLSKMILFGHYATLFPEEILDKTNIDIILLGEPDNIFENLIKAILSNYKLSTISGIAYKTESGIIVQKGENRISHPDILPMPAYELLKAENYFEPFLPTPLGLIQSARGCPYTCNFCVKSFGKQLTYRTTEQIIEEIIFLKEKFKIRSLRFIDDTFTVKTSRVIEICQKMIELEIGIDWACLSRMDSLNKEIIPLMKKAGCKRIYFGVESGSKKVLNYLNKDTNLVDALSVFRSCKDNGIDIVGFFIIGAPVEEREDFLESIDFAIEADFDYITVNKLIAYPGTELFEKLKDQINFSLFPYKNEWKNSNIEKRTEQMEKEFYKRFYYRKKFILKNAKKILQNPVEYFDNFKKLSSYLVIQKQNQRAHFI